MKFLRKIDQFGAPFQFSLQNGTKVYTSVQGGIATIVLYTLSFIYFIYVWTLYFQGAYLPKINTYQRATGTSQLYFSQSPIVLRMKYSNYFGSDPFDPKKLIIIPQIIEFKDSLPQHPGILNLANDDSTSNTSRSIKADNITVALNDGVQNNWHYILLQECEEKFVISTSYKCADKTTIEMFKKSLGNLVLQSTVLVDQFNMDTGAVEKISQDTFYSISPGQFVQTTVLMKEGNLQVTKDLLFGKTEAIQTLIEYSHSEQSFPSNKFNQTNGFISPRQNLFATFLLKLDPLSTKQIITYPQLGEILASIGSIVQILLFIGEFSRQINKQSLEGHLIKLNLNSYFDDKGKNLNPILKGKIEKLIVQKLTLENLYYSLIKMELILELQHKNLVTQSHNLKYQVDTASTEASMTLEKVELRDNIQQHEMEMPIPILRYDTLKFINQKQIQS